MKCKAQALRGAAQVGVVADDSRHLAAQVVAHDSPQDLHQSVILFGAEHRDALGFVLPLERPLHVIRRRNHHLKRLPDHPKPVLRKAELHAHGEDIARSAVRAAVLDVSAVHVQEGRHGADDARAVFADHRQHARLQRVLALERQGGQHSGCYRRRQLGRWFLAPCRGIRGRRRRSCHLGPPSAPRVGLRRRPLERSPVFPGTRNRSKPRGPADRDGAVGTEAGSRRRCESKPEGQADTQG
mmetsp:Transcript_4011/g.10327  ORF Transcript_4011/g.10327 Transcript_4011/m.10327 type:complete len:241 (+) Transcript_4011:782-1504(+)